MNETERGQLGVHVNRQYLSAAQIQGMQREIYSATLQLSRTLDRPNFQQVSGDDLQRMATLYDQRFFDSRLLKLAVAEGLSFGWSKRLTKNAGKTVTHYPPGYRSGQRRRFEVVLSAPLLFQTFRDVDRPIEVTGLVCKDRLEAMQRVLEHELVHLLEMVVWDCSSCDQARFQHIAARTFGHTRHRHNLITQRERAAERFKVRVGSTVQFTFEQRVLQGVVNRITRRATVLVLDQQGMLFSDGKRYRKYYVPLENLRPLSA